MNEHYYNFNTVLEKVPSHIEHLCQHLFPEGKRIGTNWCVGDETGSKGQSFQISLDPSKAGCFIDRADATVKGNAIALVSRKQNIEYKEAGAWLAKFLGVMPEERMSRPRRKKPEIDRSKVKELTKASIEFAKSRGIEEQTLKLVKAASGAGHNAIVFPHFDEEDKVCLLKFWECSDQKKIWTNKNPIHTLFAKNCINPTQSGGAIIICEGQWDALTWIQMGYPAVSIPSGVENEEWIENDWVFLTQFSEIYLDFDNDQPGLDAENSAKIRLGYDRCRTLRYDCKDANEALQTGRAQDLIDAFEAAQNAPVENIINPDDLKHRVRGALSSSRTSSGIPFFLPGFPFERRPHESTLWYGHTGHGKSTAIMNQFAFMAGKGIPGMIASFEDNSEVNYAHLLVQFSADAQIGGCEDFDEYYAQLTSMIKLFDSMKRTEPEQLIATMTMAHKQLGICNFAVDNVMTLDVDRQDNTKQAEVADMLRVFVSRYPVHLDIAAHPRKGPDNFVKPPMLSEVRGASEWGDMSQNAICVFRDVKKTERVEEMLMEGLSQRQIDEYINSQPDGRFIMRKQRKNGELPMRTFWFDRAIKRFHPKREQPLPYWEPSKEEYEPADQDGAA